jgi:hypothetical protein
MRGDYPFHYVNKVDDKFPHPLEPHNQHLVYRTPRLLNQGCSLIYRYDKKSQVTALYLGYLGSNRVYVSVHGNLFVVIYELQFVCI